MNKLLEVRNLTKRYGDGCRYCLSSDINDRESNRCPVCGAVAACLDVSFDLHRNEVLGIVGESGSGKSTLVKLLHFEEEPSAGEIFMNGAGKMTVRQNILALSFFEKRQLRSHSMGIVYQNPHLGLRMGVSAGGNVAEKLLEAKWRHVGRIRDWAGDLLTKTEIPVARMDEPPRNFSGGMQQRVQIAKALAVSPKILLLDEVTTGLDLSVQAKVLDLIRRLQWELQLSVLVVSHDLGVIRLLCQRTLVMRYGRVVESGLTDQILEDPQHPYTQLLVSSQL
jgi:putative phosphonate transport system ATP-binding protein